MSVAPDKLLLLDPEPKTAGNSSAPLRFTFTVVRPDVVPVQVVSDRAARNGGSLFIGPLPFRAMQMEQKYQNGSIFRRIWARNKRLF